MARSVSAAVAQSDLEEINEILDMIDEALAEF